MIDVRLVKGYLSYESNQDEINNEQKLGIFLQVS